MNNAEYLRLMKKQRELAKMKEEIKNALMIEPESIQEPEPEPIQEPEPEPIQEEVKQEETNDDIKPNGENGIAGSDQGIKG